MLFRRQTIGTTLQLEIMTKFRNCTNQKKKTLETEYFGQTTDHRPTFTFQIAQAIVFPKEANTSAYCSMAEMSEVPQPRKAKQSISGDTNRTLTTDITITARDTPN